MKVYQVIRTNNATGRFRILRTCKDQPFYTRLGNATNKAKRYAKDVGWTVTITEFDLVPAKIIII